MLAKLIDFKTSKMTPKRIDSSHTYSRNGIKQ